jgi:hypothetical protein
MQDRLSFDSPVTETVAGNRTGEIFLVGEEEENCRASLSKRGLVRERRVWNGEETGLFVYIERKPDRFTWTSLVYPWFSLFLDLDRLTHLMMTCAAQICLFSVPAFPYHDLRVFSP